MIKRFHKNLENALGHRLSGIDAAVFYILALLFVGLTGIGLAAVYAESSDIALAIASAFGILIASTLAWVYVSWSRMAALLFLALVFTLILKDQDDE